ncbi:MAG: DUF6677 family protein [Acidobacteriota bacterium]
MLLVAAWALPGLGHVLLRRVGRGLAFLAVVVITVAVGALLGGELPVRLDGPPLSILATVGAMGMGVPYFVLRIGLDYVATPSGSGFEYGSAFILTAGLMNLLLLLDTLDIARGHKP